MRLQSFLKAARGEKKADLLLKNCQVVNVFTHSIDETSVAITNGQILGFGDYDADKVVDLKGAYISPGLIDGHIHIESTMVPPVEFARAVLPCGTTSVITDPHEIANVQGVEGIKFMLESAKDSLLDVYMMLPSCVPATNFETSGACLTAQDMKPLMKQKKVLGLGEMMNYPGVVYGDKNVLSKLSLMSERVIDGHAPGLSGKELNTYVAAGIKSDHETTNLEEAREKLARGMYIMIREGSTAKNMEQLLPLINDWTARFCLFVSDDLHPNDILDRGHLNYVLKKSVDKGLDPITAISMVTYNPAVYFGLKGIGAIAPGYQADLVVFEDLKEFKVSQVLKKGKLVVNQGLLLEPAQLKFNVQSSSMDVEINENCLKIKPVAGLAKVIGVLPDQIVTEKRILSVKIGQGEVVTDLSRDVLKIAVFERHKGTGNVSVGLIQGFGLKKGAIASSVSHDSHNIVAVGATDNDIIIAVKKVIDMGGGQVVSCEGKVKAALPLPIAGLMSDQPIEQVVTDLKEVNKEIKLLGCPLKAPFMTLAFMALPVIPELKITDKGLVDVDKFKFVSLFGKDD